MSERPLDPVERASWSQRLAAGPETSAWVSASAGSGKTKVLTDRVLTLLLSGCLPERILCLTFTKAAAAEMANRLADRLAEWAILDSSELRKKLQELLGRVPTEQEENRASKLFARVLDAAGGMKIQTIHGFCQSLLGRFPLEARLSPHFRVLDERGANELLFAAQEEVFGRLLKALGSEEVAGQPPLLAAFRALTRYAEVSAFKELMAELTRERSRFQQLERGLAALTDRLARQRRMLALPQGGDGREELLAACSAPHLREKDLQRIAAALAKGGKEDQKRSKQILGWLALEGEGRLEALDDVFAAFLTGDGSIRKRLLTKAAQAADAGALDLAKREAESCLLLRERRNAFLIGEVSAALLMLGSAILECYEERKRARALVDYDDMVLRSRDLLLREGLASWVLYKLDGGLDHVLVDEAQDTNPEQWQVIEALTTDFFAGEGAQEALRTVFAVGDVKQSIYSFQRADPRAFLRMTHHFESRVQTAGQDWRSIDLDVSFRSTPAVLQTVDWTFENPAAREGLGLTEEGLHHRAVRSDAPGRVELWPLVVEGGAEDPDDWALPLASERAPAAHVQLAQVLAQQIWDWTLSPEKPQRADNWLAARGRRIRPGDILVLVRRRSEFVEVLVRELKTRGVPVAGVDRMVLSAQIAVQDLIALGRFLLLPDDDLSLASLLKSPLIGLDEERLFELAWNRKSSLFQALGQAAGEDSGLEEIHRRLLFLSERAQRLTPFAFYKEVLVTPWQGASGRERLLGRLGVEADDPLEEFLSLALAHEAEQAPSLEAFLHQVEDGELEIKRDMEHGLDAVRVMTVHGAKGLQAPVVILPDAAQLPRKKDRLLWHEDLFLWPLRREYDCPAVQELRRERQELDAQEYRRLLYVAMTRAEDRLYVCGYGKTEKLPEASWYGLIQEGLAARPGVVEIASPAGAGGLRLENGGTVLPEEATEESVAEPVQMTLPAWVLSEAPPEPVPPRPLSPSRPEDPEPALPSPRQEATGRAARLHGQLIHKLLEFLPDLPEDDRLEAARRLLSQPVYGLDEGERVDIMEATQGVLTDARFATLFGAGSRAEVPLSGLLGSGPEARAVTGQVDRLLVTGEEVMVVDYKTNRPAPRREADVAPLYLRQMASYRAVLKEIYPGRPIRCALLWTEGPRIMQLSDGCLDRYSP